MLQRSAGGGIRTHEPVLVEYAATLRDGSLSPTPLTRLPADCSGRPPRNANPLLSILKTLPTEASIYRMFRTGPNPGRRSSATKVKRPVEKPGRAHPPGAQLPRKQGVVGPTPTVGS